MWGVLLFVSLVLVGCGLDNRPLSERSATASAEKKSEPIVDPQAQAVEGFKLWDAEKPDEPGAVKLWRPSCEAGNDLGCTGMGSAYVFGAVGVDKDLAKGREMIEPTCARGNHRACSVLGQMHFNAWAMEKDIEKARALWLKGCEAGVGRACFFVGINYRGSDGPPSWHDEEEGERFLKKSCDLGYRSACKTLKDLETAAEIEKLREVVKTKWHSFERDAQCAGKGLPPFRKEFEGGTFDQNEKVAKFDGCVSPFESRDDALRNTFCCPYEERK